MPTPQRKKRKTAFILGGGASRGVYQAGCLKRLEEEGIVPDLVIGSSIGVCNALVYARRRFEHRGHQLLANPLVPGRVGHLVEARHELVALVGDELELLLDAEAEGRAASERVLHARQRLSASSRDRVS